VTKYLREINLKGMISVHGPLAQLLLGLWHSGIAWWKYMVEWRKAAHLMAGRKQCGGGDFYNKDPLPKPIKLWIHKWINPLLSSEPSWSSYLPKSSPLNTAALGTKP
jgi:hypothetical protein